MIQDAIRRYFERIAPDWDRWQAKSAYYHAGIRSHVRGMIPPGGKVLEVGTGTGDLLASLSPGRGVGVNLAAGLTERAKAKHAGLEFLTIELDRVAAPQGFKADYAVLASMLDYAYDVSDLMESLRPLVADDALVVITTNNPLWAPLLRFASRVGQRIPDAPGNFITNRDIRNVLEIAGFDVVEEGLILPVPKYVPLVGGFLNKLLPELPILRYASSVQYLAARPHKARPPLSVSVVIPCHDEEGNIADCVRRIPDMGAWTEILVMDDGSKDRTRALALELKAKDKRVRLIATDKNQGKASAVRTGFEAAKGDVIMILDADMAVAPEDLPRFLKPLQDGTADFVNGTRLVYPMQGKAMKLVNFLGNKMFCFLVTWILRQRISDTLCGTKALMRKDYALLPRTNRERWGDFELLFGAARLRLRILEVPIHYFERRAGRSKMRVIYDGWLFLKACWHGWRMLRFPDRFPWSGLRPAPVADSPWKEEPASAGTPR